MSFIHIASKGQDKLIIKQICATSFSGYDVGFPLLTLMGSTAVKVICYFFIWAIGILSVEQRCLIAL